MYPSSFPFPLLLWKVFPHASFWATRPDGLAKHLSVLSTSASTSASASALCASATRASFVLPELLARKSFLSHFCLSLFPLCWYYHSLLFLEKRSILASFRKLFNSWRKYDHQWIHRSYHERARKCFLSAFFVALPSRPELSCIFVRNRRNTYCTLTISLLRYNLRTLVYFRDQRSICFL